ncbi:MAG: hypothetical protein HY220_02445 [Candidatus Sungbacteria bacterium]|uniref:Uncharacterized protein n=1 Tax=Candidatus Sungiibacteriota bacterium TaxID=2750080 RepID=A0A9D6QYM9_9BACT|nr:hypothetical protein [Candidatus Sungbacteria bacterium]
MTRWLILLLVCSFGFGPISASAFIVVSQRSYENVLLFRTVYRATADYFPRAGKSCEGFEKAVQYQAALALAREMERYAAEGEQEVPRDFFWNHIVGVPESEALKKRTSILFAAGTELVRAWRGEIHHPSCEKDRGILKGHFQWIRDAFIPPDTPRSRESEQSFSQIFQLRGDETRELAGLDLR